MITQDEADEMERWITALRNEIADLDDQISGLEAEHLYKCRMLEKLEEEYATEWIGG